MKIKYNYYQVIIAVNTISNDILLTGKRWEMYENA